MKNDLTIPESEMASINKGYIDFQMSKDVLIRFVYMTADYTACIYYKGMYDGRVQNIHYKEATKEAAYDVYVAYLESELFKANQAPKD